MPPLDDMPTSTSSADREAQLVRYGEFQYAFIQFFTEHLVDCRRSFDGNLDDALILAILGQSRIRAFLNGASSAAPMTGTIGASRLADVSGIPRETVRRRLARLKQRGWVTQNHDGGWEIAGQAGESAARRDLAELDRRNTARMMRFHGELSRLIARYETPSD